MLRFSTKLQENSINRLVITSFIFVLLLPMGFFVYSLFQNSWQQVEQKMLGKHQLVSTSLVEPFTHYISTKQQSLQVIGQAINEEQSKAYASLSDQLNKTKRLAKTQNILDKHLRTVSDFVALSYSSDLDGEHKCVSTNQFLSKKDWQLSYEKTDFHPIKDSVGVTSTTDTLSSAFKSTVTGKPVVLLKHQITDANETVRGVLYAEISLLNIATMCSKINFGVLGHCATVDQLGQVIAHPNKGWVKDIRNISKISIVQKMLSGESGTTVFYSPFLKADMVAGFSAVPQLGWGIMIPQPKAELTNVFDEIRQSILLWLLLGVLIAAVIAWKLAAEINKPIKLLMQKTDLIAKKQYLADLGKIPENSPKEIKQLWSEFYNLLSGLQKSHNEVERLNQSLHRDIEKATTELRDKNKKLYELSTLDYLTALPNRRFFTQYLNQKLVSSASEKVSVIFIDVDHFKSINDNLGHDVGDAALIHLSQIFGKSIRKSDVVARLGGDEFVIYVENVNASQLADIAEKIRSDVEKRPLLSDGKVVQISLSIGTISHPSDNDLSAKDLFKLADKAMYESKTSGRNKVTNHSSDKQLLTG